MGRPHKLTPHQRQEARERRDRGETLVSIARSYNVHHATIGRLYQPKDRLEAQRAALRALAEDTEDLIVTHGL